MNNLLSALALPVASSAVHFTLHASSAALQPFANALAAAGGSLGAKADALDVGAPRSLTADSARTPEYDASQIELLRKHVDHRLADLLDRRLIKADPPLRLRVGSPSELIGIEGDHPQAAWLAGEINADAELAADIRQLAAVNVASSALHSSSAPPRQLAELRRSPIGNEVTLDWLSSQTEVRQPNGLRGRFSSWA